MPSLKGRIVRIVDELGRYDTDRELAIVMLSSTDEILSCPTG
jgi:hypothetical protein